MKSSSSFETGGLSRRSFVFAASGLIASAALGTRALASGSASPDGSSSSDGEVKAASSASDRKASSVDVSTLGLVEDGKLTIGSDCDYPPFIWMEGEEPKGFEVELMRAICDYLGLEMNYLSPQKFDTIIPSIVVGGKMDVGVSSITITEERMEQVAFTDPYCDSNQSIAVMKDSGYESEDDLVGKTIAVHSGTTGEAWAKENLSGTIVPYDDQSSAFAALAAGKADAFCEDLPIAQYMVANSYPDCEIMEEIPTGEQYAIALSLDNEPLLEALNEALAVLTDDGTVDKIYAEYISGE